MKGVGDMRKLIVMSVGAVLVSGIAYGGAINKAEVGSSAKWVVHLDVDRFLNSKIGKLVADETANEDLKKGLDALRATIHFDPLKDIKSVTLYGDNFLPDSGIAVVKGSPSAEALNAFEKLIVLSKTHEQVSYGSHAIHKWVDCKKQKPSALCFYAPGVTVLGGNVDKLKEAMDVLDGKKGCMKDNMPEGEGFLLISARKDNGSASALKAEADEKNPARAAVFQNAQWLTAVVGEAGEKFGLELKLGANSAESAAQIQFMALGMTSFLMLNQGENQVVADIVKAISVTVDNSIVGVRFSYPSEPLFEFLKDLKSRKKNTPIQQGQENAGDGAT